MYTLVWSIGDNTRKFLLRSRRYFLGRPHDEDLERLGESVTGLDIVVFNPEDYRDYLLTGYQSLTVSRRHALLYYRDDGKLVIRDHGKDGKGSSKGTLVNGQALEKGGSRVLGEGDTIQLTRNGPLFVVAVERGGRTVVPVAVNVPTELPPGIAKALGQDSILGDIGQGAAAIVITHKPVVITMKEGIEIRAERKAEQETLRRTLWRLAEGLNKAIEYLLRGEKEEARMIITRVSLKQYREALIKTGEIRLVKLYDNIISIAEREDSLEYVQRQIISLRDKLHEIINLL